MVRITHMKKDEDGEVEFSVADMWRVPEEQAAREAFNQEKESATIAIAAGFHHGKQTEMDASLGDLLQPPRKKVHRVFDVSAE